MATNGIFFSCSLSFVSAFVQIHENFGFSIVNRLEFWVLFLNSIISDIFSCRAEQTGENLELIKHVVLTYRKHGPLALRAVTKVLHSCLFWASFRLMPQVWFRVFISLCRSSPGVLRSSSLALAFWCPVYGCAGDITRFFPKHVPNTPPPSPLDNGLHDVLTTTIKQLSIWDGLGPEDSQDSSQPLCMENGELVKVTGSHSLTHKTH